MESTAVAVQIRHFHADGGEGQILTAEAGSVIALIAKLRVQIHLALGGLVVHEIRVHLIDHGRAAGVGGRGRDRPAEEIGVDRIRNILEGGDEVIDRALDVLAPFPAFRPADKHVHDSVVPNDGDLAPHGVVRPGGGARLVQPGGGGDPPAPGRRGVVHRLGMVFPVQARGKHGRNGFFQIRKSRWSIHLERQDHISARFGGQRGGGEQQRRAQRQRHAGESVQRQTHSWLLVDGRVRQGSAGFFSFYTTPRAVRKPPSILLRRRGRTPCGQPDHPIGPA